MLGKKINTPVNNIIKVNYRFNINETVFCTVKNNIKDAVIISRYTISGENFYKIGNKEETKICKESQLIHR